MLLGLAAACGRLAACRSWMNFLPPIQPDEGARTETPSFAVRLGDRVAPDAVDVRVSTLVAVTFLSAIALGFIAVRICRGNKSRNKSAEAGPLIAKEREENV